MSVKCAKQYEDIPSDIINTFGKANPFFFKSVAQYYSSSGKQVFYFFDDERIMPLVISKKYCFRYGYLPTEPWVYSGQNAKLSEKCFLDSVIEESKRFGLKLDWIGQTPPSAMFLSAPANSISIPFGNYVIDLTRSEEDIWADIHSKHRNVIRKAEKNDVKVICGGSELIGQYLYAEKETMERSGLPSGTAEEYLNMFDEFKDHVLVFLARQGENIQGGAIILYDEAMGYYMHGASINTPVTGAMNYVQWEIIKHLKALGVKRYSFVGCRINEDEDSKYHGIQLFKKRFGGELIEGRMFKVINNHMKYSLYKYLIKIRTGGVADKDIIDQEIHKWQ